MGFVFIKSRGSRITTYTNFTRLQQDSELKTAPFSAPLTNLLNQIRNFIRLKNEKVIF